MTQIEIWQKIEAELMAAYALLPKTTIESDNGYRKIDFFDYIAANELLLAMEELDGVIEDNPSPSKQFWNHLIQAANLMGHSHADRYKSIQSAAT
ncbi:hypothetical protein L5163_004595 [Vibrio parahaemolyticus]|nr:hypothetical protein [Vibrio parahaemolyticus]ELV8685897.1 hypothetical protein [Vibrio vulnificus]